MIKLYTKNKFKILLFNIVFVILFINTQNVKAQDTYGDISDTITYNFSENDGKLVISGSGELPDCMTDSAFDDDKIPWSDYRLDVKSIVIDEGITYIGQGIFHGTNAEDIVIADSVKKIGKAAFDGTPFLKSLTDKYVILGDGILFKYNGTDKEIVVPDGVKVIGNSVFNNNKVAEKITIPEGVESIEDEAIFNCINLKYLKLPSTITSIGSYAFGYYLSEIDFGRKVTMNISQLKIYGADNDYISTYCSDNNITYLSPSITSGSIDSSFNYFLDVETGELVVSGEGAMTNSSNLFPNIKSCVEKLIVDEGITALGTYNFSNMTNLKEVSLPSTLVKIGDGCFNSDSSIEEITIPRNVGICDMAYALYGLKNLKNIYVEDGNETYYSENGVLYDINKERLIKYPAARTGICNDILPSTKNLGEYCFEGSKLSKVYLPEGIDEVYRKAFSNAKSIVYIEFLGKAPGKVYYEAFSNIYTTEFMIAYHSTNSDWSACISELNTLTNVIWNDLDDTTEKGFEEATVGINSGEKKTLSIIGGMKNSCYTFVSDNPSVVIVSTAGEVLGCNNGTANITANSKFGDETYTCEVTVSGYEEDNSASTLAQLEESEINYKNVNSKYVAAVNEEVNGYYYLNGKDLFFHSFYCNKYELIYSLNNVTDAYVDGDILYILDSSDSNTMVTKYNLSTQSVIDEISINGITTRAIGIDKLSNIYLSVTTNNKVTDEIFVYDKNGVFLASCDNYTRIYRFAGFDKESGDFYYESYYNWICWGYEHSTGAVKCGNYKDGKISVSESIVNCCHASSIQDALMGVGSMILYQNNYSNRQNCSQIIGDKYLLAQSNIHGRLYVKPISKELQDIKGYAIGRAAKDGDELDSLSSVGINAVYNQENDSIIYYANNNEIKEVNACDGSSITAFKTAYKVFNMHIFGNTLILIEKDDAGKYYIEKIKWTSPTYINVDKEVKVKVSETKNLTVDTDAVFNAKLIWSSADSSIASVTNTGKVIGWKKGTTEITVKYENYEIESKCLVTVEENTEVKEDTEAQKYISDTIMNNSSANNYTVYGSTVKSYMYEENGNYIIVENHYEKKLTIEDYSTDFRLVSSKEIEMPLDTFGGFYHGKDANYIVVGQKNENESNSTEVLRIIKYSLDFENEVKYTSVNGANTYIPFDAGSCRLAESENNIYVYTCHEMYVSEDGNHHQANMTFVFDKESLDVKDSYYDIGNTSYGYVSHSFNQFIDVDSDCVYRIDHGDSNPRGIYISMTKIDEKITNPYAYRLIYNIESAKSSNYNATGVSVGGMELADNNVIVAMNSVDFSTSDYSERGQRNIVIVIQNKELNYNNKVWLTNYTEDDNITPRTPHIVKVNDNQLIVMWEEYNSETGSIVTKLVAVDNDGNVCSDFIKTSFRLSDCKPFLNSNGEIIWYVKDGKALNIYSINPYCLEKYDMPNTTSVKVESKENSININWTKVDNATGYIIYRKKVTENEWTEIKQVSEETLQYDDTEAVSGQEYIYAVRAQRNGVVGLYGTSLPVMYIESPEVTLSNTDIGVKVTWTKVDGCDGYYVYCRCELDKNWSKVATLAKTKSSYEHIKVGSGYKYFFAVSAYKDNYISPRNEDTWIVFDKSANETTTINESTTKENTTTVKPVDNETTTKKSGINSETTKANENETTSKKSDISDETTSKKSDISDETTSKKPNINDETTSKKSDISDETTSKKSDISDETTSKKSDTNDETTPYYENEETTKKQSDINEETTKYTEKETTETETKDLVNKLSKITISVNNDSKGVKISWKKVSKAKGYNVYRKNSSGKLVRIATIKNSKTTKYVDKKVSSGKKYTYAIKAYNSSVNGNLSAKKTITYLKMPVIKIKKSNKKINISWKKITGAKGYYLYRKVSSGSWKKIAKINYKIIKFTDKNIKSGKKYKYKICSYNGKTKSAFYAS